MQTSLTKLASLFLALPVLFGSVAQAADDVADQLLKMTGGKRTKVIWMQNDKVNYLDTKVGKAEELPFPAKGGQPLLTVDGRKVLCTVGETGKKELMMYDTETKKLTTLTDGQYSSLLTVWRDPKTKRDWVYVNDAGFDNRGWDQPWGEMHRFPMDKPAEKEKCWDRTTTHIYFMLSADGTRACFEPTWANIGQLNLEYDSDGKIDQEKSEFKKIGGGCFPGLAPDNSYRMFRLDGEHKSITLNDADGENPRKVVMTGMPGVGDKGKQIWLTRWSTHPRYISCMGPDGEEAKIWLGRFNEEYTEIEEWVQVATEGPKCWQSHAWIEQDGAAAGGTAGRGNRGSAGGETVEAGEWPAVEGAVFAMKDSSPSTTVVAFDEKGREAMGFSWETLGRSLFGRNHELVCDGGSFVATNAGAWIGSEVAKSRGFTLEVTMIPEEAAPAKPGVVMAYANAKGEDVALVQDRTGLVLRMAGNKPIPLFKPQAGRPVHVVVLSARGKWLVYRNGKSVGSGTLAAQPPTWGQRELLIGAGWKGVQPWRGRVEGVAVFARPLLPKEATAQALSIAATHQGRTPSNPVRFQGTLVRQAKTSSLEEIRPYNRSLTMAEYKVDKVLSGEWTEPTINVLHWMIMDNKRLPLANRKPGAKVELTVEPLEEHPQLESSRRDEIEDADLDAKMFYCESEGGK